jgi:hypothetical protein
MIFIRKIDKDALMENMMELVLNSDAVWLWKIGLSDNYLLISLFYNCNKFKNE